MLNLKDGIGAKRAELLHLDPGALYVEEQLITAFGVDLNPDSSRPTIPSEQHVRLTPGAFDLLLKSLTEVDVSRLQYRHRCVRAFLNLFEDCGRLADGIRALQRDEVRRAWVKNGNIRSHSNWLQEIDDWLTAAPDPEGKRLGLPTLLENGFHIDSLPTVSSNEGKSSHADVLLRLLKQAGAIAWHDPERRAWLTIPRDRHFEHHRLESAEVEAWLKHLFLRSRGSAPSSTGLSGAMGALEAMALFDGEQHEVLVRVGAGNGIIFLDLADNEWRAVKITSEGWSVVNDPPIRFRRHRAMRPLAVPSPKGHLSPLWELLNIGPDDRVLLAAWLVAALRAQGPYPLLALTGQQGSAKSTTARVLRALVDPNLAPLRGQPREGRDVVISAGNSWILAFDNLSRIPGWLSDLLCTVSTGGGFATRELYTNNEEMVVSFQRPVILTSIADVASKPDLLDRALMLDLPPIPAKNRLIEEQLWSRFAELQPAILGALLDAVAAGLARLPHLPKNASTRMADFELWAAATEEALGFPAGAFATRFNESRAEVQGLVLQSEPVAAEVFRFICKTRTWTGTATELLEELNAITPPSITIKSTWPSTASKLGNDLRTVSPALEKVGVHVEFLKKHGGRRQIALTMVASTGVEQLIGTTTARLPRHRRESRW
ncbi:MAG: hypothetical protein WD314_08285 [Trueperaceae bacterium]